MAMGVLQALKLQKGSLREIAMLPQQQIMVMAQRGQIPAAMVPIVLSEKAQMAKEAQAQQAMMQAQQPPPPTVTEQNMQAIQGAEDEEAMRRRMMAGVGSLPMQDDTFRAAGGGIVAFAGGGDLPEDEEDTNFVDDNVGVGGTSGTFRSNLRLAQELLNRSPEEKAYLDYYKNQAVRNAAQAEQDKYMSLINIGARIMGGTSPYAFTNIGQGVSESMPEVMQTLRARRQAEADALKAQADIARGSRESQVGLATELYKQGEATARAQELAQSRRDIARINAAKDRDTDMVRGVRTYAAAYARRTFGKGYADLTPEEREASDEFGLKEYQDRQGAAAARAQAALSNVGVARQRVGVDITEVQQRAYEKAEKAVNDRLSAFGPEFNKYLRLANEDRKNGTNTAEDYRSELIEKELQRAPGAKAADTKTKEAPKEQPKQIAPEGLPKGAVAIGKDRKTGKTVYQTQDGKQYIEE